LLNDLLPQNDSPIFCRVSINNDEKWVHGIITYINMEKNIAEIFFLQNILKAILTKEVKSL